MTFNPNIRKLISDSGYIRSIDGKLYSDHPIFLGINDVQENYEEGNETDYLAWMETQKLKEPELH